MDRHPAPRGAPPPAIRKPTFKPARFADLAGFDADDHAAAFAVFQGSCAAIIEGRTPLREALAPDRALIEACRRALALRAPAGPEARHFFETNFQPFRAALEGDARAGFFTGYYEPFVEGSLTRSAAFPIPLLSAPRDLASHGAPARAAIEAGALADRADPIVWLRDKVEVFLIQGQGCARVRLPDGRRIRLTYAGRNGWPYRSIGRILIESGAIAPDAMSLAALKAWIRAHGQADGEPGAMLMQQNESYVFFTRGDEADAALGPIGGAGLALAPLRSLAVDRAIYPYGMPVWIDAAIRWRTGEAAPFQRLMIAQDTGSAIIGAARADIFFGGGEAAGALAGDVRHAGEFVVFLPIEKGSVR